MSAPNYLFLQDAALTFKVQFYDLFGKTAAQRECLEQQLAVRVQRYSAGNPLIAAVKESLALCCLSWSTADLDKSERLALEALAILEAANEKGRLTFRIAVMLHLRSQIQQRLHHPRVALELAEDAFRVYNRSRMICWQRARLMESLIQLHRVVGDPERARTLTAELQVLRAVLNSRSARHLRYYGMVG